MAVLFWPLFHGAHVTMFASVSNVGCWRCCPLTPCNVPRNCGGLNAKVNFSVLYVLSLMTDTWSARALGGHVPCERSAYSFSKCRDDHYMLFGGRRGQTLFNDLYALDVHAGTLAASRSSADAGGFSFLLYLFTSRRPRLLWLRNMVGIRGARHMSLSSCGTYHESCGQ